MLTKYLIYILLSLFIKNARGQTTTEEMPSTWKTEMTEIFVDKLRLELSKLRDNLERRFDFVTKLEEKLEEYSESKLEKSLEGKLENTLRAKLETTLEENLRNTLQRNIEDSLGKKLEGKLEETLDKKYEDKFEKKHNTSQTGEWIKTSIKEAISLDGRAVIAGYESDGSPLWIATFNTEDKDLVPGKLNPKKQIARSAYPHSKYTYIYYGKTSESTKVYCAPLEKVRWVECRSGYVPPNAVVGGYNNQGETLYIGRAKEEGALIPGWVQPSKQLLYIVFGDKKKTHDTYEVLCLV